MDIPLWIIALISVVISTMLLLSAASLVYAERKLAAFIQQRFGPNRVGPRGLLQPFADVLKLVMKEDIIPVSSSRFIHALAPFLMILIAFSTISVVPLARGVFIADVGVGILVILALTSLSVYGVTLAGWSSNSKYSLLGGLRSSAQMVSYELSMGAAVVSVVVLSGTLSLTGIVESQAGWFGWYAVRNPIGFIIFFVTALAETNRAPFDLPEAEQELVGGYHTEYSGMKFGMFFLAEYVNMFMACFFITTLFLGGYLLPFEGIILDWFPALEGSLWLGVLQILALLAKAAFLAFVFIWIRWTLPRLRYDQLMRLGWQWLLPIALGNVILIAGLMLLFR